MRERQAGDSIRREAAFGLHNLGSDARFRGSNGKKVTVCAVCALCSGVSIMFFQNGCPKHNNNWRFSAHTAHAAHRCRLSPLPSRRHLSIPHSPLVEKRANKKSDVYLSRHSLQSLKMCDREEAMSIYQDIAFNCSRCAMDRRGSARTKTAVSRRHRVSLLAASRVPGSFRSSLPASQHAPLRRIALTHLFASFLLYWFRVKWTFSLYS